MYLVRSHNKQRLLPYTSLADRFGITEFESVYSAVRTESLYKTATFSLYSVSVTKHLVVAFRPKQV
jgi:hypothetical protein